MAKKPPVATKVSIERDGKTYAGSYTVANGVLTVRYRLTHTSGPLGRSSPDMLASILLIELVEAAK